MKTIFSALFSLLLLLNTVSAQSDKDAALETLGASGGLLLYNTYIAIGAIGDAYAGNSYEATYVKDITKEQIASIEAVIAQYNKLLSSGFLTDPEDKSFVGDIVMTLGYLKSEAKYLGDYADTNSESDSEKYQYNREEAWKKISKLLQLEE